MNAIANEILIWKYNPFNIPENFSLSVNKSSMTFYLGES